MWSITAGTLAWAIQPQGDPLQWNAPPPCPDVVDVRARARRFARDPATTLAGEAIVEGVSAGSWRLRLRIGGLVREYNSRDCEALADLAALSIAVAADPVAVATAMRATSAMSHVAPSTPARHRERGIAAPTESPSPRPDRTAVRRPRWTTLLGIGGVAGVAELPRADLGPTVSLAVERRALSIQLRGGWLLPQRTPIPTFDPAQARLQAANGSARVCGQWRDRALSILGCGGLELGALIGASERVRQMDRRAALWVAALGSVGLRGWIHPRVALEIGAEFVLGIRRPRFGLQDNPFQPVAAGAGGVRGAAGVLVRLSRPR